MYAAGFSPDECADLLDHGGGRLLRPALPHRSLLSSRSFRRFVRALGPEVTFEDMEIPLAIVTADLTSGREVVLHLGLVWQAIVDQTDRPGSSAHRVSLPLVDGTQPWPVARRADGRSTIVGAQLFAPPTSPSGTRIGALSARRPRRSR
jgi:hypothetical protein